VIKLPSVETVSARTLASTQDQADEPGDKQNNGHNPENMDGEPDAEEQQY
jgi:hypothetical protein